MKPIIHKSVNGPDAYFTVNWAPILPADKYTVLKKIPAMSGIFKLFYEDPYKKLILLDMDIAWYGGLRSSLRDYSDPFKEYDPEIRVILETKKLFCRYTMSESFRDLTDVLSLLAIEEYENPEDFKDSGRYKKIFLREESPNKIVTI